MKNTTHIWGQKKHERTIISASSYFLSKMAFHLAPEKVVRFMREKGFSVKPYPLSARQHELLQQAQSFFLEFNRNKIRVYEWGSGPVILLVHGWGGRAVQMDAFISALVKKGFKVAAFDQKGHGESSTSFSSYPEFVRSTDLVAAHYADELHGVIAHSMGANSIFKVSENFDHQVKMAAVAPVGNFLGMLEKMRMERGIYEKLFARLVRQIEAESGLLLSDLNEFDYEKINRHDVLLVHDKFDRVNKITASQEIQRNLHGSSLIQTEMLGHSRILANQEVVDRVVAHFTVPRL
jgi:predicted alpha/beta-fold hydrolase